MECCSIQVCPEDKGNTETIQLQTPSCNSKFNLGHQYQDSIMANTGGGPGDTETGYGLCAGVATANKGNAHDSALTTGALLICAGGTITAQINTPPSVYF